MRSVYAVTYDIKLGTQWASEANPNGWGKHNVITNGDARDASDKTARHVKATWEGKPGIKAVRVLKVELIATDVI